MVDVLREDTTVNGILFKECDIADIKSQVREGSVLYARFNPLNAFDANAIAVRLEKGDDGPLLGHVERSCAARVAAGSTALIEVSFGMRTRRVPIF